ncbi:hypothetical protein UFOVP45_110 [uncultured Caudovirales phage]|uniref:Uncharacterized protein n=1 Tax=uncultured Caudovirales phage TaxID=2100421 RepID=A0A6J5KT36_9CAUD|nr:hypothetical protein UFOVP45_110 [uncultured Caudovirales phage]
MALVVKFTPAGKQEVTLDAKKRFVVVEWCPRFNFVYGVDQYTTKKSALSRIQALEAWREEVRTVYFGNPTREFYLLEASEV